ncbi:MAG TPA: phasin family protein [Burkholderiaceae bacterium]|nr:phasin family protein [Burkholderiaceae bacterium]
MVKTPEDLAKLQSETLQASSAAAQKTLEGFKKLTDLNLQAAKASLEESSEQIRALLAAKDVKTLTELITSYAQPSPEKYTSYAKAVYSIARETNSDLANLIQEQIDKGNKQFAAAVEQLAKSAPAGSEGAVNFIRQALASANQTYEQLNKATKQFVSMGEATLDAAAGKKR